MDFEEARKSGVLTVYTDTDPALEREVKEYNKVMSDCRVKMKRVRELELAYFILNPLVVFGLLFINPYTSNTIQLGNIGPNAVFIIFAAVFVYFGAVKKNLVVPTAASVLLFSLHIGFAILTAADAVLVVWHVMLLPRLKRVGGYPLFLDISVRYERFPEKRSGI